MIRINQLKVSRETALAAKKQGSVGLQRMLKGQVAKAFRISEDMILNLEIVRESIDARKKPEIFYIYTVDVYAKQEGKLLAKKNAIKGLQITQMSPVNFQLPQPGSQKLSKPIVIVGSGPAGLFCGYFLAKQGYRPIILERGKSVEERQADVQRFWESGVLDTNSNVQFGEGGAGTFSDGKLNTLVKDKDGRNKTVLQVFVDCGAKEEILYEAKPHIGTDVLCHVIKTMREQILAWGGAVRFLSQVTDVEITDGRVASVTINENEKLDCELLVLATGHSARDTFRMLYEKKLPMEAKSFAVGFRVEHPQEMINRSQYGVCDPGEMGAAPYKVVAQARNGRGVYSFCMCPGGYVVNASSEEERLAVNGMSYSGRNGKNANSAIIVAVTPEDFGSNHPLAGVEFQRELEAKAYRAGNGKIPMQRYSVFKACVEQQSQLSELPRTLKVDTGMFLDDNTDCEIFPEHKGESVWADLTQIMPEECNIAFVDGMESFARQIKGFQRGDAILSGVESRTSSPVRIHRDETLQTIYRGIYPCGEGAGYAGGITSAAMDGLRVAEQIIAEYSPEPI